MIRKELIRRYFVFCISLLIIALGISIITRSDLGTSPITSVPYVASLNTSVSLGMYFFLFTLPNSLLYQMIMQDYEAPLNKSMSYDDALFVAQSRIIRRIASEKPCIIVGRCADYILKDRPNTINVFLYANMEFKINRVINEYGVSSDKALETIKQTDKNRKEHYFHYTGQEWGYSRNYNITFDTSTIPISNIADFIKGIYTEKIPE